MIFDPFDNIVHNIATSVGKPDDQCRLLLILLIAYPLGYIFRFIRGKWQRHAYSIIVGIIIHLFMFRGGVVHFWGLGVVVYTILSFIDKKKLPWVVFIVCLMHISAMHIYRLLFDFGNWTIDSTTFLMPLVSRLSSLGFVYADGAKDETELSKEQNQRKIVEKPTFLEILSYISFPCANVCGPFFEFRDYIDFIEENGRYKSIPGGITFACRKLLEGIVSFVFCIGIPMYFGMDKLTTEWFFNLPYYLQYPFWMIAF